MRIRGFSRLGHALLFGCCLVAPAFSEERSIPVFEATTEGDLKGPINNLTPLEAQIYAGSAESLTTFGAPEFFVLKGTALSPSYVSPSEYELAFGRDGQISAADEDIIFDESEALDTRDDIVFEEGEGLDLSAQRPNVIDLDTVAAEQGPVDLFSDAPRIEMALQDGQWASSVDDIAATGCPPGVETAAMGSLGLSQTRSIVFTKPSWHPSDMSPEFGQYTWRPVGNNGYFSTAYETGPEAAGSGMALAVTMALNAVTETEIAYWGRVQMNLAPHLAAMVGGSESCTAIVTGKFQKRG